MKIVGHVTQQH